MAGIFWAQPDAPKNKSMSPVHCATVPRRRLRCFLSTMVEALGIQKVTIDRSPSTTALG